MELKLIFTENKCTGYFLDCNELTYPLTEQEDIMIIEINSMELQKITGGKWEEEYQKLILVNEEIQIDKEWEPLTVGEL